MLFILWALTILSLSSALRTISLLGRQTCTTRLQLTTADFRNGLTIELDESPVKVIEFLHVKPGKGAAFVRTKIKNLITGSLLDKTFRAGESIVAAEVNKVEMQFTYSDGEWLCFMNMETFDEERISKSMVQNELLLKEGLSCTVLVWNGRAIDVQLPEKVEYTVAECPPNFKGNSMMGAMKPATLDTGAVVNVPMFIEPGERIFVSTSEVKYIGRVQK